MNRAPQFWLFTTVLTLLAIALLVGVAALSAAFLPPFGFYVVTIVVGAGLALAIGAIVRWLISAP